MTIISLLQNSFLYREREKKTKKERHKNINLILSSLINVFLYKKLKFLCKSET